MDPVLKCVINILSGTTYFLWKTAVSFSRNLEGNLLLLLLRKLIKEWLHHPRHVLTCDEVVQTDSKSIFRKSILYCYWMFHLVTFKKAVIVFLQTQTIFYPLIHFNLGAQLLMGYASTPEQFRLILFLLQKYITVVPQYIKGLSVLRWSSLTVFAASNGSSVHLEQKWWLIVWCSG